MQDSLVNGTLPESVYCNETIIAACREMRRHYDRPLDYVVDKMLSDPHMNNAIHDPLEYQGILAEYRFADMLDWLSEEKGWDISYLPKMSIRTSPDMIFFPRWRVNCILPFDLGEYEYGPELDAFFRIGDYWTVGEAKSGTNGFQTREARERIELIRREFHMDPAFILAVPEDHARNGSRKREILRSMGIGFVTFPENSQDFTVRGEEIYRIMEGRARH